MDYSIYVLMVEDIEEFIEKRIEFLHRLKSEKKANSDSYRLLLETICETRLIQERIKEIVKSYDKN